MAGPRQLVPTAVDDASPGSRKSLRIQRRHRQRHSTVSRAGIGPVRFERREVVGFEGEFRGQDFRIAGSNSERNDCADRPHEGRLQLVVQLLEVLMGERERDAILADTREHLGEGRRTEGLKLVDVHVERGAVLAAKRRQIEADDEERTEKPTLAEPELALRQVGDEDLPTGEDVVDVEAALRLADDVAEPEVVEELADLVERRETPIALFSFGHEGEVALPKISDARIAD